MAALLLILFSHTLTIRSQGLKKTNFLLMFIFLFLVCLFVYIQYFAEDTAAVPLILIKDENYPVLSNF